MLSMPTIDAVPMFAVPTLIGLIVAGAQLRYVRHEPGQRTR